MSERSEPEWREGAPEQRCEHRLSEHSYRRCAFCATYFIKGRENMSKLRLVSGKEWRARAEQAEALLDEALELLAAASGSPVVFVARLAEFLSCPEVKERRLRQGARE